MAVIRVPPESIALWAARWRERAERLAHTLETRGLRSGWVAWSETVRTALDPALAFAGLSRPRVMWRDREMDTVWLAAGESVECNASLEALPAAWRQLRQSVALAEGSHARWFAGAAFDPAGAGEPWQGWPLGWLWLPRVAVRSVEGMSELDVCLPVAKDGERWCVDEQALQMAVRDAEVMLAERHGDAPEADPVAWAAELQEVPARGAWLATAHGAVHALRDGRLRKVVLARALCRRFAGTWSPERILRRLLAEGKDSYIFAVERAGGCFFGATPERLCRVRAGTADLDALAGSRPRGRTPEEDAALAAELLTSGKDLEEHGRVVEWLVQVLQPISEDVVHAAQPRLRRFSYIQHLHTPVQARLRADATVLDVAARIHPTPAVGGVPQDAAIEFIRDGEGVPRGWYAGPVGWLDHAGDGEFAVALRCALVTSREAWLYAGAGMVAGSKPEVEWEETGWKLRPMMRVLGWPEEGVIREQS